MGKDFAIVAEIWERPFAWWTVQRSQARCPVDCRFLMPDFLGPIPQWARGLDVRLVPVGDAFFDRDGVRENLMKAARDENRAIEVRPGAEPNGGDAYGVGISFVGPVHRPAAKPDHRISARGPITIVDADVGSGWFDAMRSLAPLERQWPQYGPDAPIFVANTNDFQEPPPPPCSVYFVLASGLLGLRLVLDSKPPADARMVIFDINPNQLNWARFVLDHAADIRNFDTLVTAYADRHPDIQIRGLAPHETSNAEVQRKWYAANRARLSRLRDLSVEFVCADILTDPEPVLSRLIPGRPTFFMYLDLFSVWHYRGDRTWIFDMQRLAAQWEDQIRSIVGPKVEFCPGMSSRRIQFHDAPVAQQTG